MLKGGEILVRGISPPSPPCMKPCVCSVHMCAHVCSAHVCACVCIIITCYMCWYGLFMVSQHSNCILENHILYRNHYPEVKQQPSFIPAENGSGEDVFCLKQLLYTQCSSCYVCGCSAESGTQGLMWQLWAEKQLKEKAYRRALRQDSNYPGGIFPIVM